MKEPGKGRPFIESGDEFRSFVEYIVDSYFSKKAREEGTINMEND
jgi:hypothetical protein